MSLKIPKSIGAYCLEVWLSPQLLPLYAVYRGYSNFITDLKERIRSLQRDDTLLRKYPQIFLEDLPSLQPEFEAKWKLFVYWLFQYQGGSSTPMKPITYWICIHSCLYGMNQEMKKELQTDNPELSLVLILLVMLSEQNLVSRCNSL